MEHQLSRDSIETLSKISKGRHRTNLLKKPEQRALAYLVERIPDYISSNTLTFIGFIGSLITFSGFLFASLYNSNYLLLGILGFIINWFGDSLDGRVAYFRNKARKWYGFSLDLSVDWITTVLIGLGFMIYSGGYGIWLGFIFVVMYGWEMIITLLRYKVIDKYAIDSGLFGPTEVRVIICLILMIEVIFNGTINYLAAIACLVLLITNISDFHKLLQFANNRDITERELKQDNKND